MKVDRDGQVVITPDCYVILRSPFAIQHPTSAETCMWGNQLDTVDVIPEVKLKEHISHTLPTLALNPRGDIAKTGVSAVA